MIVLDANVLIAVLDRGDAHHRSAAQILSAHPSEMLATPILTMAEALVGPCRRGAGEAAADKLTRFGIRELGVSSALDIAMTRAASKLPLPDVVVLQASLDHAATLATFDERLARVARGLRVPILP